MPKFDCEGVQTISVSIDAETREEAAAKFRGEYDAARLDYVGDDAVVGTCEDCGLALFEGEDYFEDSEGVTWHRRHEVER